MPLSSIQKEKLKELELERGGVAFVSEKSKGTSTPTVVISLGGLGGKTLNALKGKFIREIGESDHIYFKMIDTDKIEIDNLCKMKSDGTINDSPIANLEQNETILLYDPMVAHLLHAPVIPPYIKKWVNNSLIGTVFGNLPAQQIRQLGRVILANDVVYNRVYTQLSTIISDAITKRTIDGNVNVIIIAGVSGGTGSGIIIDMAYMIHNIFRNLGSNSYKISGYIYTPDVQFSISQVAHNPAIRKNLMRNGYAALKEIDYFMNIDEMNGEYRLELGSTSVVSSRNIFDCCMLVSGYSDDDTIQETELTINRLTEHLIDMLTDISIVQDGNVVQMSSTILRKPDPVAQQAWFMGHQDRSLYHRYATYKYQVLGHNSIVVPRDEIYAYCVNKIYQSVLTEFQNLSQVNRDMSRYIFSRTNISNPDVFVNYAVKAVNPNNPIKRTIRLNDEYTKKMIADNHRIAYDDACQVAQMEKLKINGGYQCALEKVLYEALKQQVDQIFEQYGPYMAVEIVQHKSEDVSVGNPQEPFPGIIEQLVHLSNVFLDRAEQAANAYRCGGEAAMIDMAISACRGLFPNREAICSYVDTCCQLAEMTQIDPVFFGILADVLYHVAHLLEEYNHELFESYTEILSEVQNLLDRDGHYFDYVNTRQVSIDIIKIRTPQSDRVKRYLDDIISRVDARDLARNFIKKMKDNKDKWLAHYSDYSFDVVNEVRQLMDECLVSNGMKVDIVEKIVAIAYGPTEFTPEQWVEIWEDNSPNSPKTQALQSAAGVIYHVLMHDVKKMAKSSGRIPFDTYPNRVFLSVPKDTPKLSAILSNMLQMHAGWVNIAFSDSKNKFTITQQYTNIPMYVFKGMDEYNMVYNEYPSAGRHMDEQLQNWGRFPNPYTVDSVAADLIAYGRPMLDMERYYDYQILLDSYKKTLDGINKYKFVEIRSSELGWSKMFLYHVTEKPENMDAFKDELYKALRTDFNLDIIKFMKENGFGITPVEVRVGQTDIALTLIDFKDASMADLEGKYRDLPVRIPDVFKWLRKSIRYMDIIDNSTAIFESFWEVVETATMP